MPCYSYFCESCNQKFEIVCSIKDYQEQAKCELCSGNNVIRLYIEDLSTLNVSIKKHTSELSTIGDVANRNRDSFSNDQKAAIAAKNNAYREEVSTNELPKGMSRIKKTGVKTNWKL